MKKGKTIVLTRLIELFFDTSSKEEKSECWKKLKDIQYHNFKCANEIVMSQYMINGVNSLLYNGCKDIKVLRKEEKKKEVNQLMKEKMNFVFGQSQQNITYSMMSEIDREKLLGSYVFNALNAKVYSELNTDKSDIARGLKKVRNYKKTMPIYFMKSALKNLREEEGKIKFNWVKGLDFVMSFYRKGKKNKSDDRRLWIQKIMNKEVDFGDPSIKIKGNQIFLLLPIKVPIQENKLNKNIVVGVDLGINIPVYVALNKGDARASIGSRESFLNERLKIQIQRRKIQKSLRYAKGGKGRKKLKNLKNIKNREKNFAMTMNHNFSKMIIDFALRNNAGVIHLENLSGIGKDEKNDFILRNWSYFDLQSKILYKAKRAGIEVKFINPWRTSKCCPTCGEVGKRSERPRTKFWCINELCIDFEKEQYADYVGAKNIANNTRFCKRTEDLTKRIEALRKADIKEYELTEQLV